MQYLDLVRDAGSVFNLPDLPPNSVEENIGMVQQIYTIADAINHRNADSWLSFDSDELKKWRQIMSGRSTSSSKSETERIADSTQDEVASTELSEDDVVEGEMEDEGGNEGEEPGDEIEQ